VVQTDTLGSNSNTLTQGFTTTAVPASGGSPVGYAGVRLGFGLGF